MEEHLNTSSGPQPEHGEAHRKALHAVIAVDPTGSMLQKWSNQGESAAAKLNRLEQRLQKRGINVAPQQG